MCQSENDIPVLTKHVELMTLQNTSITVPEPVFTIQLDMHVPEVRDSPDAEILENLHGVPNNEDEYPNLQLSVNINHNIYPYCYLIQNQAIYHHRIITFNSIIHLITKMIMITTKSRCTLQTPKMMMTSLQLQII